MQPLLDRKKAAPHFENYKWNYLPKAILDGHHGEVRVDDLQQPNVSVLHFTNLPVYFIGGDPGHPEARHFVKNLKPRSLLFFADQEERWSALCEELHGIKAVKSMRYAFTSQNLNLEELRSLRDRLPAEYTLKQIDLPLAAEIQKEKGPLTEDHILTFDSVPDFLRKGFGYVIMEGEKIVSIASTFVVCDEGIEIQINTRKGYEGRGLGTAVGAALIVHALENDLTPNWDAATKTSAHLAKKFGYTEQGEYPIYVIFGSKLLVGFLLFLKKLLKREKKD